MNPTPTSISSSYIKILLSEFDASGQDAASFARARGIAAWRLRDALDRRAGKPRPKKFPHADRTRPEVLSTSVSRRAMPRPASGHQGTSLEFAVGVP